MNSRPYVFGLARSPRRALSIFASFVLVACASKAPPAPVAAASAPAHGASPGDAAASSATEPSEADAPIPITRDDPTWGSRTALVTIVEFADFQCPYCSRVAPTLDKLRATYGPQDLRIVYKHLPLPFHPHARPAAEAAHGVFELGGNDAFWRFYTKAYTADALPESFDAWAGAAGVDVGSFKSGIAANKWSAAVDADIAFAAKIGVSGTPAFFVNGVLVSGAQPLEKFQAVVDDAIVQAKDAIDHGVPRNQVYLVASTFNRKNAPAQDDDEEPRIDEAKAYKMPIGQSPARGPATAPVTIVEFADFQCPYCGRAEAVLTELRASYGDRLRVVWKNEPLPFHPRAEPAAELAYEARAEKGDAGFWDMHDRLLADQVHLEDADLIAHARATHLDVGRVAAAMASHKYHKALDIDDDVADEMNAVGTPYFFINGRRLVGAQPAERFRKVIDEEETKARALVAKGVAPTAVYDELQKQAEGPPPPEKSPVSPLAGAPSRGAAGASVVIYEFADFECPFCKRGEDAVEEVLKNYPGRVRVEWRNLPLAFHPDAEPAAEAAMEAYRQKGNDGFWKMHDLLFAHQPDAASKDGLSRQHLEEYAAKIGLDMAKFKGALDQQAHKSALDAETEAAHAAGIAATPAFVINGYFLSGAHPYASFRRLVDRALAEHAAPKR